MRDQSPQGHPAAELLQLVRACKHHILWQKQQGWSGMPLPEGAGWSFAPLKQHTPQPTPHPTQKPSAHGKVVHPSKASPPPVEAPPEGASPRDMLRAFATQNEKPTPERRTSPPRPREPAPHSMPERVELQSPAHKPPEGPLIVGSVKRLRPLSLLPTISLQEENQLFARLGQIREEIGPCTRCELSHMRQNILFGDGPVRTRVMVIIPQPSAEDDASGATLEGEVGVLIKEMLKAIGVKPQEVYFAYHIKCRPPEDRHPFVKEVHHCLPFITEQIRAIQPEVVLAMGVAVAQSLLQTNQRLEGLRQRWFPLHENHILPHAKRECMMLVTYHPLYLLQRPARKRNVWQDLQMIRRRLIEHTVDK